MFNFCIIQFHILENISNLFWKQSRFEILWLGIDWFSLHRFPPNLTFLFSWIQILDIIYLITTDSDFLCQKVAYRYQYHLYTFYPSYWYQLYYIFLKVISKFGSRLFQIWPWNSSKITKEIKYWLELVIFNNFCQYVHKVTAMKFEIIVFVS